jgi:hypothetical protein
MPGVSRGLLEYKAKSGFQRESINEPYDFELKAILPEH